MKKKDNGKERTKTGLMDGMAWDSSQPMSLTFDYDLYAQYLEDSNLSEEQKRDFLQTLWSIVVTFVDLGFGIHPLQQACEQNRDLADFVAAEAAEMLESKPSLTSHYKNTANSSGAPLAGKE